MPALTRRLAFAVVAAAAAIGTYFVLSGNKGTARAEALYAQALPAPTEPMSVYHLGHSLVGRNMPAMLAQLMGVDYRYDSQLGWGTPLRAHYEPDVAVNGFDVENAHPRFRAAKEATASGAYDAVVLTEMVEIRDAIRYHDSAKYLARWADDVHKHNPAARIYLYETWHHIDDPEGWLARLDADLEANWLDKILYPALGRTEAAIYLIPGGQVMGAFVRAVEDAGGVDGINGVEDLFARTDDGSVDTIHFNDKGAYLMALTHYAVLTHRSPVGLPHDLRLADGTAADAPGPAAAQLMQQIVWRVVTSLPQTGVPS